MSTACNFSEMPLFIYLSLRFLRSLFKSLKTNVKNQKPSTRYTCTTDLDLAYLLTQWKFWQLTLKWLSGACAQDKTKQYYCCFLCSYFIQLCDSRKIHYLTREFALNSTWKLISHSSLPDSCNIGFRVQFNAEFRFFKFLISSSSCLQNGFLRVNIREW